MHGSILQRLVIVAALVLSPRLFTQRTTGAYIPPSEEHGDVFDDPTIERPHTLMERWERSLAENSPPPIPAAAPSSGTVSVDQLRHPLSAKGERLIEKSERYAQAGDHAKAIVELRQALDEPSSVPYAHSLLGIEYLQTGDPTAAISELVEAIRLMPGIASNHSNLGYAFCLTGKRDAAEHELGEAIKLDRIAPQPRYLMGLLLLDRGSWQAGEYLRFAQRLVRRASLALAIFHTRHGQSDAARQDLRAYLGSEWAAKADLAEKWITQAARMARPSILFGLPTAGR